MTDTSLFETTPNTKYDSWDVDALKRKALAADEHINTLTSELAEIRSGKSTDAKMEELLNKLTELSRPSNPSVTSTVVNHSTERTPDGNSFRAEDIDALVSSSYEKKQKETEAKNNVARLHKELKAAWGDNYRSTMTNKARELGVNENFFAKMAEDNPDLLLKIVLDKPRSDLNSHTPPSTVVNTRAGSIQVGNTYKDFKKAMKDNPSLRTDPDFVAKMHEAAERLGDSFYN